MATTDPRVDRMEGILERIAVEQSEIRRDLRQLVVNIQESETRLRSEMQESETRLRSEMHAGRGNPLAGRNGRNANQNDSNVDKHYRNHDGRVHRHHHRFLPQIG